MYKTFFNWSTGKDSALALHQLLQDKTFKIECLFTTVNSHHERVTMHGLRTDLLQRQVQAMDIPLRSIALSENASMEEYENKIGNGVRQFKKEGFEYAAFGDIFLEDLRQYRDRQLGQVGIKTVYPLWKKDTKELLREFIETGFKAIIICADADLLGKAFIGRILDKDFLADLPSKVDPCGENGEFHTFCFDGPLFKNAIEFQVGEKIYREYPNPNGTGKKGYWFCDLL